MQGLLYFAGGAKEVGRNAVIYKNGISIVIDYGLKLFSEVQYPLRPEQADLVVISHAHLDHSGHVPFLYEEENPLALSTFQTKCIAEILWEDNAKIMGESLIYSRRNLKKALSSVIELEYSNVFDFHGKQIEFYDAGHILGSSLVMVRDSDQSILYTCDMNSSDTRLHKGCRPLKTDVLILESTYSDRDHGDRKEKEKILKDKIRDIMKRGGTAILPAFAVGRTQELIAILSDLGCTLYIDGMGNKINEIYLKNRHLISDFSAFRSGMRNVEIVKKPQDRRKAMRGQVVIATAGMLEGGPALNYIMNSQKNSEVIFTGYCVPGTNGWKLQHGGYVEINGAQVNVDIPVSYLDFSAHSGRTELFSFAEKCNPSKIFCIHGDNCEKFAQELRELGFDAVAPENGKEYSL